MDRFSCISLALAVGLGALACSGTSSGTGTGASSGGAGTSGPAQACLDTADATAKATQRCGQDYKMNYDAFINIVAKGNCSNVTQVRDEAALRGVCLPSLAAISCPDLMAGKLDASCKGQLLRPAAFSPALAPAFFETMAADE
jgi:hypothetical protein